MAYQDYMREAQERLEDKFVDEAERAINRGLDFDTAFPSGWAVDFRLSPVWRERYEKMTEDAKPYRQYNKEWSADGERRKIQDLRQAARQAECDEKFYQSNAFWMKEHIKAGHSFAQTEYPEHMRPLFERAEREQLGFNREEAPAPEYEAFSAGFQAD